MQEKLFDLIERYAAHIHQICYADRKLVQEDLARFDGRYYYIRYESCWIGDGAIPGREMLSTLSRNGFDDYVSLKWEKSSRFGHHLPPSELALEHFPTYMRELGLQFVEGSRRPRRKKSATSGVFSATRGRVCYS